MIGARIPLGDQIVLSPHAARRGRLARVPRVLFLVLSLALLHACSASSDQPGVRAPAELHERATPTQPVALPQLVVDGRLDLSRCLRAALQRNPGVQAAMDGVRAEAALRPAATALPDPMLRFGWFAESIQTRTGAQEFTLGFSQAIPWPGKLSASGRVVDAMTRIASQERRIVVRNLLREISQRYHELAYLHGAVESAGLIEEALQRAVALALRGREPGSPRLPELVRAEQELERVRHDALSLRELLAVEEAALRAQLALPANTPLAPPAPPAAFALDTTGEELVSRALSGNHELRLALLRIEAARERRELATQSFWPDFNVGGRWIQTDARQDANPPGNGDDPLLFEVGMTLPLQVGAKRAKLASAEARVRAALSQREAMRDELRPRVLRAVWKVKTAQRSLELYGTTLLPQARESALAAEALHGEGKTSFASMIETQITWLHHRLAWLRARSDHLQALAELESLVGVPFERQRKEVGR